MSPSDGASRNPPHDGEGVGGPKRSPSWMPALEGLPSLSLAGDVSSVHEQRMDNRPLDVATRDCNTIAPSPLSSKLLAERISASTAESPTSYSRNIVTTDPPRSDVHDHPMSKQTPYSLRHDALHNAVSKSASSHLPQGTTQHLQTDDASRERRNARGLELFKAMNLVINEAPLEVLLPLRQTCHSLYQRADGRLLWHFAVGPDGIDLAARRKNELDIDIHSPNTEPRHVLDIRGPDEGCIGCNTDAVSERLRCTCIRKRLRQLRCLSGIRFDMVRVWVNSNQNLGNFQRGEDNILKAQTTVYIVDIDHKPNKAVYLPTAPIGGSPEVTIIMVVDPAATGELSAQSHFASGQPNPNATYSYLFASNNPSWYSIPTTNNWPGAPVNDEIAFMDVFMVHFAQIQLATKPAWTYLVGSEVWPSDWLAAHRLQEDDWEQKYDVAVQNYVQERVFPLLVRVDAVRKHVQGVFKADEMMHAVTAAGRSYGWQTLAEFDERWQAKHGLPLSFVLCC